MNGFAPRVRRALAFLGGSVPDELALRGSEKQGHGARLAARNRNN
jgi:hypothetical protein